MAGRSPGAAPLRVLESFRAPRSTTNPYLSLLLGALPADVEAVTFGWRRALTGRYDVLHVHWPEVVVRRANPVRGAAAALLLGLVLVRCRLTGRAVVRTAHNLRPHEEHGFLARAVLRLCDRWTTWYVRLNDTTPTPAGVPATTILHGHYRDWFAHLPRPDVVPGRLLYFGLVRPYKGVEELLEVFGDVPGQDASLRVVGRPSDPALAEAVRERAARDARVSVRLEHVPDEDLAQEIGAAELVVLPYREMHNSGAALLALSLGRPVLVPDNAVTAALAAEVGDAWVLRFDGALQAGRVARALREARDAAGPGPDLSGRDWPALGRAHADVFAAAVAVAHGRGLPGWRARGRVPADAPAARPGPAPEVPVGAGARADADRAPRTGLPG